MEELKNDEYQILRYLLAKVENRHDLLFILLDVIAEKYEGNRTKIARAIGYSPRVIRLKLNAYKRLEILQ